MRAWIAAGLLALAAAPSAAQGPPCADYGALAAELSGTYRETLRWRGIGIHGRVVEIWAAEGGAGWSLVLRPPGPQACLVLSGDGWEQGRTAGRDG